MATHSEGSCDGPPATKHENMRCFYTSRWGNVPSANSFLTLLFSPGMTKVKMGKGQDESNSLEFVEKRRAALERFLNRSAAHPKIRANQDFKEFLEKEEVCSLFTQPCDVSETSFLVSDHILLVLEWLSVFPIGISRYFPFSSLPILPNWYLVSHMWKF